MDAAVSQFFSIVRLIFLLSLLVSGCLMASHSSEDWLTYHSMTCRCSLYPMTLESKSIWAYSIPGEVCFFVFCFFNKTDNKIWKKSLPQENVLGKNVIFFTRIHEKEVVTLFYPSVVLENSIIFFFDSLIKPYKGKLLMNLFIDHSFT